MMALSKLGLTLVTLFTMAWPAAASATTIAIAVDAGADAGLAQAIFEAARRGVSSAGFEATRADVKPTDVATCMLLGELEARCASSALARVRADQLVFLSVERGKDEEGEVRVVLTGRVIAVKTGEVLVADRRFCERCFPAERLDKYASELAAKLVGSAAGGTFVAVTSVPAGGRVRVDETVVGTTSENALIYGVLPGPHTVSVDRAGYELTVRSVIAAAGETTPVDVTLKPRRESGGTRSGSLKWVALGGGVAAMVAGVTLIAIHEPPFVDGGANPEVRNTRTAGIVTLVGGAALAGAGVALWTLEGERGQKTTAGVLVTPGQALVGLGGTF